MAREREGCVPKKLVIVGGGKMGEAILRGWLSASDAPADELTADNTVVVDPGRERRAYLEGEYGPRAGSGGISCVADAAQVAERPDLVVLAVKPQVMMGVLENLREIEAFSGGARGPLFVSIAAGLATSTLEAGLPEGAPLVRVMPNMPLAVGAGASAVCGGAHAAPEQVAYVTGLFDLLGRAVVVDERDMDAVCALSGSGPAYVAAMIEALRDAAADAGLDAGLAEALALQTVLGTARLIDETGADVADTRISICSPGGTTLAALDAMGEAGFAHVFDAGVKAAIARSKELAKCT